MIYADYDVVDAVFSQEVLYQREQSLSWKSLKTMSLDKEFSIEIEKADRVFIATCEKCFKKTARGSNRSCEFGRNCEWAMIYLSCDSLNCRVERHKIESVDEGVILILEEFDDY